jgi:hypothetical protein
MQIKIWVPSDEVESVVMGQKPSQMWLHRPETWPREKLAEVTVSGEQYKKWTGKPVENRSVTNGKVLLKG